MVFRGILCFPIGKVQQDVSYNAEDGEPHQRLSDASCAFAIAHGGRESGDYFPPFTLQLRDGPNQMGVCLSAQKTKADFQPIPTTS